ncbi:TetR/AcrR family transcriptional regulator [Campylobacter gastrosuis]|uniref:TetR/AcrR family transcriptional regulator n=1 Tax=Campylobacter gastrosuis TaxID=2974576 RepID=A0ABT7HSD6_9BACT|nr:TetR/AcrR family transcriptional regulator [Campylobacter gastrosuis]MDL0089538.1 TetR/AcrR family transcriptional regulator [Campylobacter gastrosuis]
MKISKKGEKRRDVFVETALELFLQNGYEGTSLSDIVQKSGGSLASIYKFFNNKEGLFSAVLDKKFSDFYDQLNYDENLKNTTDLREFLYKFALAYIEIFYKPQNIAFARIIISESYKNKELGEILFKSIISKIMQILIDFFEKVEIKKQLKNLASSELLAHKFCALIREPLHISALLMGESSIAPATKEQKEKDISAMVELFLAGICK